MGQLQYSIVKDMRNIRTLYGQVVKQTLTWSVCLKADVKLAGMLLRVLPLVYGQLTPSRVKVVWGFAKNVRRMYKHSGAPGLAKYLKTCAVLLQQAAGSRKVATPHAIGCAVARSRRGLPRIINAQQRALISRGDILTIRLWLTLFGLYRVIEFKGALKLATITNPGKDLTPFLPSWIAWIPIFYKRAEQAAPSLKWSMDPSMDLTPWSLPPIRKSSPNSGGQTAMGAVALDILSFAADPEMWSALKRWLKLVDGLDLQWALNPIYKCLHAVGLRLGNAYLSRNRDCPVVWVRNRGQTLYSDIKAFVAAENGAACISTLLYGEALRFGSLGFKEEPGKIRVFAMVNLVTQGLMYPLHQWIFKRLALLPTDGTFDQTAPVERMIKKFRKDGRQFVASYDLSAATDRLPIDLQVALLEPLLGREGASNWRFLLTGRPYFLPRIARSYNAGKSSVTYAVGQPMGALSSWAMLALTHHAIVQYAASKCYPDHQKWFLRYAVLGDDIVIADKLVAEEYLKIMEMIGVEVGIAKSLLSNTGSLEFAKRTWINGRQASPISLAETSVALSNLGALNELIMKCRQYGSIRLADVARFLGFGYKCLARLPIGLNINNRLRGVIVYLCRPGGVWPMTVVDWLTAVGPGRAGKSTPNSVWQTAGRVWETIISMLVKRNVEFEKSLYEASTVRYSDATRRYTKTEKVANGRLMKVTKVAGVFSADVKEIVGLEQPVPRVYALYGIAPPALQTEWNTFFQDWIGYPLTNRLRKTFEKIDDTLRVLSPRIQPQWQVLEDIWTQVFEAEDGQAALPKQISFFEREQDEVLISTRLVNLWRRLRKVTLRVQDPTESLSTEFNFRAEPRRRRRGG